MFSYSTFNFIMTINGTTDKKKNHTSEFTDNYKINKINKHKKNKINKLFVSMKSNVESAYIRRTFTM